MATRKNKIRTELEVLEEISSKLTELTAVVGISGRDKEGQVGFLVSLGHSNSDISRITGIPKGTVDGIRAGAAKKAPSKKAAKEA